MSKVRLAKKVARNFMNRDYISIDEAEDLFKYFHLSDAVLSKSGFKFTPRIPETVWTDNNFLPVEDNFTPRISLSASIKGAQEATHSSRKYVFAGDLWKNASDDIDVVDIDRVYQQKCKQELGSEYGPGYGFHRFLAKYPEEMAEYHAKEYNVDEESLRERYEDYAGEDYAVLPSWLEDDLELPKKLPPRLREKWKYCVPDVEETNEKWATEPIYLIYLGEIVGNEIKLSLAGKEYLTDHF